MISLDVIRHCIAEKQIELTYPKATPDLIEEENSKLGFEMPKLLEALLLEKANGGFGPGYGLIGTVGGAASDLGSLAEAYRTIERDSKTLRSAWKYGLLPFVD